MAIFPFRGQNFVNLCREKYRDCTPLHCSHCGYHYGTRFWSLRAKVLRFAAVFLVVLTYDYIQLTD